MNQLLEQALGIHLGEKSYPSGKRRPGVITDGNEISKYARDILVARGLAVHKDGETRLTDAGRSFLAEHGLLLQAATPKEQAGSH